MKFTGLTSVQMNIECIQCNCYVVAYDFTLVKVLILYPCSFTPHVLSLSI